MRIFARASACGLVGHLLWLPGVAPLAAENLCGMCICVGRAGSPVPGRVM